MQTEELIVENDDTRFAHCIELLKSRYLAFKIDDQGNKIITETPRDMFDRVAKFLAENAREYERFFHVMYNLDALPNSPTLWGSGMQKMLLNACAVLEVQDSTEDIMHQLTNGVILQKLGSGVGYYLGNIRAKDLLVSTSGGSALGVISVMEIYNTAFERLLVSTSGGSALGVISVMEIYNTAFERIQQGGKRRGAFMAVLPVWHEEIFDFILCKDDPSKLQMFNNSISFTDKFMNAVKNDDMFQLYSPINGKLKPTRKVRARDIWQLFILQSHKNGEPSALFIDTIQRRYPNVKATNPCSETLIEHKEFCNLASINLMNHLCFNKTNEPDINWEKLRETIKTMTIFLNRVIDKNYYPDEEYRRQVLKNRKIGLGIMGFADILIYHYRIKYSSIEARDLARKILRFIREQSKRYSERYGFQNRSLTCIAPTGSLSLIAGVSSGIEPIFARKFTRRTFEGMQFDNETLLNEPWVEEANEISPLDHLRMVAAVSEEVDMGVSKTINFLPDVSKEDIGEMYMEAWKSGITGITCYRDGSRGAQPLVKCDGDQCHL